MTGQQVTIGFVEANLRYKYRQLEGGEGETDET